MRLRSITATYMALVPTLAIALAACGAPSASDTTVPPTAFATSVPAATAVPATSAPEPTSVPAATAVPATSAPAPTAEPAALLPAPLYLLNDQQQLERVEADGKTAATITDEKEAIGQFSISPVDGSILYVVGQVGTRDQPANQRLVSIDAHGGNRNELLKGALFAPAWTPDGQGYAVTWQDGPKGAGVYTGSAKGGAAELLVADLPRPADGATPGQRYSPLAWSPDGKRLLLAVAPDFGPEAPAGDVSVLGLGVTDQAGNVSTLVESGGNPYMCLDPSWSDDATQVYCANYGASGGQPALWRIAAPGGQPELLIVGKEGQTTDVFNAREIDGQLYAFVAQFMNGKEMPMYAMERFAADGSAPVKLREESLDSTAVIWSAWAPDGSGAVIQKPEEGQPSNRLIWAPVGDDLPTTLAARAFGAPQWGIAQH